MNFMRTLWSSKERPVVTTDSSVVEAAHGDEKTKLEAEVTALLSQDLTAEAFNNVVRNMASLLGGRKEDARIISNPLIGKINEHPTRYGFMFNPEVPHKPVFSVDEREYYEVAGGVFKKIVVEGTIIAGIFYIEPNRMKELVQDSWQIYKEKSS